MVASTTKMVVPTKVRLRMLGTVTTAKPNLRLSTAAGLVDLVADAVEAEDHEGAFDALRLVLSRQAATHTLDLAKRERTPFHVEP